MVGGSLGAWVRVGEGGIYVGKMVIVGLARDRGVGETGVAESRAITEASRPGAVDDIVDDSAAPGVELTVRTNWAAPFDTPCPLVGLPVGWTGGEVGSSGPAGVN